MPTTNSPKGSAIPVRPTPQMRQQLDALSAAGFGNQTDVLRTAIDRMHQQETRHMNSGLTDNACVKRVNEIRQMVSDVDTVPVTTDDVEFYIKAFLLETDEEIEFARKEFVNQYGPMWTDK